MIKVTRHKVSKAKLTLLSAGNWMMLNQNPDWYIISEPQGPTVMLKNARPAMGCTNPIPKEGHFHTGFNKRRRFWGWGCSSVIACLPSKCRARDPQQLEEKRWPLCNVPSPVLGVEPRTS
jgi:hypothetical protein